jgi:hypothetical protein
LNNGGLVDPTGLGFSGPFGMGAMFEITAIVGFTETIANVIANDDGDLASVAFDFVDSDDDFFAVYFDDLSDDNGVQATRLSGQGYGDGQLILSTGIKASNGGAFNVRSDLPASNIDQAGVDNWDGVQTVNGGGGNDSLVLDISHADTVWDSEFFQNGIGDALLTNINLTTPFGSNGVGSNNPSQHFSTSVNGAVNGALSSSDGDYQVIDMSAADPLATSTLGALNGGITRVADASAYGGFNFAVQAGASDMLFSQDIDSAWNLLSLEADTPLSSNASEPHSLVLIALGLTIAGFITQKRKRCA